MNWIEVTQRTDDGLKTVSIDADLIDYIKPRISDCSIHFIDGRSIWVAENARNLSELIK